MSTRESRPTGAAPEIPAKASTDSEPQPADNAPEVSGRAFQSMPELTAEQFAALRADVALRGIVVPIVVDQNGRILDGHNRAAIAAELGTDCPREVHPVAGDDEAADLAVTLNCARRHLTREQVRQVISGELARRPGDSDRAIARRVGVDHKTVGTVRRGEIPHLSKLDTDLDPTEARALLAKCEASIEASMKAVGEGIAYALSNAVPAAEIIAALTAQMRSYEQSGAAPREVVDTMRRYFYGPLIDELLDPATAESCRPHWDHDRFEPLADDVRADLLAALAGGPR